MNVFLFFSNICSYTKQQEENKKILRGIHETCADPPEHVDESR